MTDQLERNILDQNNEVLQVGSPSSAFSEKQLRHFCWPCCSSPAVPRVRLSLYSPPGFWLNTNGKAGYQLLPRQHRRLWGPRLAQGPEQGFLEQTESPSTDGNELLEGADPGNPQCCDLPPPAARAIKCPLEGADPSKGLFCWS